METLCVKCNLFFGSAATLNLCSSCHRDALKTQALLSEAATFKIPELPPHRQQDHSRCFTCKKKIGLLGIRCNACLCSHCNAHRLPEDHHCDNAFTNTKPDPKKPVVVAPAKIEKI